MDRRLLISIAIVAAIVGSLLIAGRASAVSVTVDQCEPSPVVQGGQVTCELTLTIINGERIPITGFKFDVAGPTELHATFDPDLGSITKFSQIVSITSTALPGPTTGFGYGGGSGYGFDSGIGYGYSFFGGGTGYGYGYQFGQNAVFKYSIVIDTASPGMDLGDYLATFTVVTGDTGKETFESEQNSFTIAPASEPATPASVSATAGPANSTISWAAPTNDGGSGITGYVITSDPDSPQSPLTVGNVLEVTMEGLTLGTSYTFTVSAINAVGTGPASDSSNAVVPLPPLIDVSPDVPGAAGPTGPVGPTGPAVSIDQPDEPVDGRIVAEIPEPVDVSSEEAAQAADDLSGAIGNLGGEITVSSDLTVSMGVDLPDIVKDAVPDGALVVVINALEITGVDAGTVIETADVPDFEVGNVKVETVDGGKVATFTLSEDVRITGEPSIIVGENGEVLLVIDQPVLNADLPTVVVEDAAGGITQVGISISAPIDGNSVVVGDSFAAEVLSDPSDLDDLVGFTLIAGEQPLVGISIITDFVTTGPVTMTLEINEEAYQAMLDAGQLPTIRRISDDGVIQTFTPTVVVVDGTAFFTFVSPGFSIFALIAVEPEPQPFTAPGAPANVVALADEGQATVTWTAPDSDGGSPITGYVVESSPASPNSPLIVGNVLTATVTGLTNGTTYTFTVSAVNEVGTGVASDPSGAITPSVAPQPSVPGAPTIVVVVAGDGQVTVTWTPPDSDGGSPITGYVVASSPDSPNSPLTVGNVPAATVTGLTNGTEYTFTVIAVNAIGAGVPSNTSGAVAPSSNAPAPTQPGVPANVVAVAGNQQATIDWAAPESDGGSSITGYIVTSSPDSPNSPMTVGNVLAATMTELSNGDTFTFTVSAVNAVGTGAPTSASNEVTPGGAAIAVWAIVLIALGVIAVFAVAGFMYLRRPGPLTRA